MPTMSMDCGFVPIEHGPVSGFFNPGLVFVSREPRTPRELPPPARPQEPRGAMISRLYVNASQRCNLRCTYCFADQGHRYDGPPRMPPAIARAAVDRVIERLDPIAPHLRIVFFGGEPWLAFDACVDLLQHAQSEIRRRSMVVHLSALFVTNFVLPEEADILRLSGLPVDVSVSIDGSAAAHDRHRLDVHGRGTHARVTQNVQRFRALIPGRLSAICTITADNLDLVKTVADIMSLGFDQMCVRHVFCSDSKVNLGTAEMHQLIRAYEKSAACNLQRVRDGDPCAEFELFRVHFDILANRTLSHYPCGAGREWLTVTTAGRFYPCPELAPELSMGTTTDGLDDPAIEAFAESTGVREGTACESCRARPFCRGGCPAEAFRLTGRHDALVVSRCELARAIADVASGLFLELRDRAPDLLARYTGYRRSELRTDLWPGLAAPLEAPR